MKPWMVEFLACLIGVVIGVMLACHVDWWLVPAMLVGAFFLGYKGGGNE